jgi:hypothetical protein
MRVSFSYFVGRRTIVSTTQTAEEVQLEKEWASHQMMNQAVPTLPTVSTAQMAQTVSTAKRRARVGL